MADDRLPWARPESMIVANSDTVRPRACAISLSPPQNASSRLTLVLWLEIAIERLADGMSFYGRAVKLRFDSTIFAGRTLYLVYAQRKGIRLSIRFVMCSPHQDMGRY
jgi:hypothetical protein